MIETKRQTKIQQVKNKKWHGNTHMKDIRGYPPGGTRGEVAHRGNLFGAPPYLLKMLFVIPLFMC